MRMPFRTFFVWNLLTMAAVAQTPPELHRPPLSIRTTGEAVVTAKPDRAVIDLGVVTQAQTAGIAATQNAERLDAVTRALKGASVANTDIRTISYSIDPNYRYPKPGAPPELSGYTARNTIEVTTSDLAGAGKLIDAGTKAGANSVDRLEFTLKEDQAARAEALRQASAKAKANAEAIASALGVKITRLLFAEESGATAPPPRPVYAMARMSAEAAPAPPTPVTPGTIEVHGSVTLTFEIGQ